MKSGNGYFGKWTEGLGGLPAYLYEVNQYTDKKALTMTNEAWNDRRNHLFSFGNDKIVCLSSNFGYIQIRQDENCPKFLTDYNPKSHQFGGGFGYLKGDSLLSTFYSGQEMRREYGAGYTRKVTKNQEAQAEEILFAPYGDDPVMLKKVTIKNLSDKAIDFEWYDYMGADNYQFTFTHYCAGQLTFNTANVSRFRRRLEKDFIKKYEISYNGVTLKREFKPSLSIARGMQGIAEGLFRKLASRFYQAKNNCGFDKSPPDVAYCCLNDNPVVLCDGKSFFGQGGAQSPDYFASPNCKLDNKEDMILLKSSFTLQPMEEKSLHYVYAYAPKGFNLESLIEKYQKSDIDEILDYTLNKWKNDGIKVKIDGMEWLDRELICHNACLRGNMTYSEYFEAHILSQGGHYQYLMGLQGAPRDQLQHSLPFIYSEPYIAREHILFTLREMSDKGELPYATHGYGMMVAAIMVPSDLQLMLLNFVGEYILATRDFDFLNYKYTSKKDNHKKTRTVLEGVMLAYNFIQHEIGKGSHGLVRMKTGDWNDQAVYGRVAFTKTKYAQKHSESMLNSAIAVYSFKIFGEMLRAAGKTAEAEDSLKWSDDLKKAVAEQWNGKWFKRAFMGDKLGWLGDDLLWLEPQPWAIISGAATSERATQLAENIREKLHNPNGSSLISHDENKKEDSKGLDTGTLENGGIWPAINGYLVWALAKVKGEYAFEEWLNNSRYAQSNAYPDIWYGIWSGPDSVNASYAKYPGRTQNSKNPYTGRREKYFKLTVGVDWEDFPVFNLHAHTWQQYSLIKMLGAEFTFDTLILKPVIPHDVYEVSSPLLSVSKQGNHYKIRYNPLTECDIKLVFENGDAESVIVNEKPCDFEINQGKTIIPLKGKEFNISLMLKS